MLEVGSSKRTYWNKRVFWCALIGFCLLWFRLDDLEQYKRLLKLKDHPNYQTIYLSDAYYEVIYLKPHPDQSEIRKRFSYNFDLTYALRSFYSLERCKSAQCQKVEDSDLLKCSASKCSKVEGEDQVLWSLNHNIPWQNQVDNLVMCKSTSDCSRAEDSVSLKTIPTEELGEPQVYPYPIPRKDISGQDEDGYYYLENNSGGYDRVRLRYIPFRDLEQVTVLRINPYTKKASELVMIGKIPFEEMLWLQFGRNIIITISFMVFFILVMITTILNSRLELSRWWRKI